MEKVRQMEHLLFTLGNGSQICAVLEEFGDRPLVREALGRRCRKNELIKDVAVREKMTDNLASFMEALKTFGNRRKEDDNAMRVIMTAVCSGDMLEEKEISAVARVTGMRWEFVKECCEHRVTLLLGYPGETFGDPIRPVAHNSIHFSGLSMSSLCAATILFKK